MPMGLSIFHSIWQSYINAIIDCLQSRKYCEAIMDDLLLFTPSKSSHIAKLEDLLKALMKNGLKISPKKCKLFRTNLQYIHKGQRSLSYTIKKQIGSYTKAPTPTTVKGCRSFAGMVKFLSMFCPKLQKLLKPIYDLMRKAKPFVWGKNIKIPLKK